MAKINLVDEVLKHTDDEIIEYLYGLVADVRRGYVANIQDPAVLLSFMGEVDQLYAVLRGMKQRNDSRKAENSL